ncbi:hypothetical protein [Lactococcus lactis]|uniref:hypothetical protein n=2 Tax=Lactococcus lactis TaxID=1358 RepID=UPI003D09C091
MKNTMKKIVLASAILSLLIIFVFYQKGKQDDINREKSWTGTSKNIPKYEASQTPLFSEKHSSDIVKKYFGKDFKYKMLNIPGLRGAWSVDDKGKVRLGVNWVPQGVTSSQDKVYVSMYDKKKVLKSVIFEIDKVSGKYIKSYILDSKAHVGGISYDIYRNRLWVATDDDSSKISIFDQKTLDNYNFSVRKHPIKASSIVKLKWWTNISAISVSEDFISIAKYQSDAIGGVIDIGLDDKGNVDTKSLPKFPIKIIGTTDEEINNTLKKSGFFDDAAFSFGFKRMQGISNLDNISVFTQSNGQESSKIFLTQRLSDKRSGILKDGTGFNFKVIQELNAPPSMEEASIDPSKKSLYIIFESGAKPYREHNSVIMDKIVVADLEVTYGK